MLSLCAVSTKTPALSGLPLLLASDLTYAASTAQTESKFRLPVPDAETNPRRDELGTDDREKQQLLH